MLVNFTCVLSSPDFFSKPFSKNSVVTNSLDRDQTRYLFRWKTKTDQTAWLWRLVEIFTVRTCQLVPNVGYWLECIVLLINGISKKCVRPNEKISVFQATGLNILGRVGTHIFNCFFLSGKQCNLLLKL